MDRLTKRDNNGRAIAPEFADETYIMQDDNDVFTGYINSPIVDRLAELEDKIENGTLVELPEPYISTFVNGNGKTMYEVWHSSVEIISSACEDAFYTREEAEKRIEELKK